MSNQQQQAMTPERIRRIRERLQLTQQEFASRLGFTARFYVSHLEAGRKQPTPTLAVLLRLVEAVLDERGGEEMLARFFRESC